MPIPRFARLLALPVLLASLPGCRDSQGTTEAVDGTAPAIQLELPAAGSLVSREVTVSAIITDAGGVARASLQVDGGPESDLPLTYDVQGDGTRAQVRVSRALPAGTRSILLHAFDKAGNRGSSPAVSVRVDGAAPVIRVTSGLTAAVQRDTMRLRIALTDDDQLEKVEIRNGTSSLFFRRPVGGTQLAVDTLVSLTVGANEFTVTATDAARNESSVTVRATRTTAASAARLDAIGESRYGHGCGLRGAAAFCWGDGTGGALGNGRALSRDVPVAVSGGLSFSSVAAGGALTCGVTVPGDTYCWGSNLFGALGAGSPSPASVLTPQKVAGDARFATVTMGLNYTTCALTAAGEAYCWGNNELGQAGVPRATSCGAGSAEPCASALAPARVQGGLRFASISVGMYATCAVALDGRAHCWGSANQAGLLGNGMQHMVSEAPVAVSGDVQFTSVSVGTTNACGVAADGAVYCWGWNRNGALGDGTTVDRFTPARVSSSLRFRAVGVRNGGGACALAEDGTIHCWGDGRTVPAPLSGGLTFTRISPDVKCGLTADGSAYCWKTGTTPAAVPGEEPA
jgi:alpha-tubulin suppressor-like RCC1 family protein